MKENANITINSWFTGLLTILFVVLKLTGFINWSWLWVLSPLWIGFLIFMVIFLIVIAIMNHEL